MKVTPIKNTWPGEHVVAVDPAMSLDPTTDWQRRMHLYRGRSLGHTDLTMEQQYRAGHLAIAGQMRSPGVISGLEIAIEESRRDDADRWTLQINPGYGLATNGEDVVVPSMLRVPLRELRVFGPATLGSSSSKRRAATTPETPLWQLGPTLDEVGPLISSVCVIVLQPIVVELAGERDPSDPCEYDPQQDAFEDWQLADGCRVLLYMWPSSWLGQVDQSNQWRNQLAYTIFDAEAQLPPGVHLPWNDVGVPIGLIAFDEMAKTIRPAFIDRHSVVRMGGQQQRSAALVESGGNTFLWQSRLEQFAQQLSDDLKPDIPITDTKTPFQLLPPAGLLPEQAIEIRRGSPSLNHFFPASFEIDAVPVPTEQLDIMMKASASLAPYDVNQPDDVRVLVPVPQTVYEPHLLRIEQVAIEFHEEVDRLVTRRGQWLNRRSEIRLQADALTFALTGRVEDEPSDPEKLEDHEPISPDPVDPNDPLLNEPESIYVATETIDTNVDDQPLSLTTTKTSEDFLDGLLQDEQSVYFDDLKRFKNLNVTADRFHQDGLEGWIEYLENLASKAEKKIGLGELRVLAESYRIRQFIMGTTEASQMALSPVLGSMVKGLKSDPTRQDLNQFLTLMKKGKKKKDIALLKVDPRSRNIAASRAIGVTKVQAQTKTSASPSRQAQVFAGKQSRTSVSTRRSGPTSTRKRRQRPEPRRPQVEVKPVSVGQLQPAKPIEAKRNSIGTRYSFIKGISNLGLALNGVKIHGIAKKGIFTPDGLPQRIPKKFEEIDNIDNDILNDPAPEAGKANETTYFVDSINVLDSTYETLQSVKARVQLYHDLIRVCRDLQTDLREVQKQVNERLSEIDENLEEARHDVAVARSLLTEEQNRIDAINERRDTVLAEHVDFLAFHRPRTDDLLSDRSIPVRTIDPGLTESPIPACLDQPLDIPPELGDMIDLVREAPAKWFTHVPSLLRKLDRLPMLYETIRKASERAHRRLPFKSYARNNRRASKSLSASIGQTMASQIEAMSRHRALKANFDLSQLSNRTWQSTHQQAQEIVSLGDLVDAGHRRKDVARQASEELDQISKIATCLYADFGQIPPPIRLKWVEVLSQFDTPVNLRNPARLRQWGEIDYQLRTRIQMLLDWLYGRVNPVEADAVSLITDLARVCLLLASHAPVKEIISGHVVKPAPVVPNGLVELKPLNPWRVRVGMGVMIYKKHRSQPVARAVVEDLTASAVSARIVHTLIPEEQVSVEPEDRVQFEAPETMGLNAFMGNRFAKTNVMKFL